MSMYKAERRDPDTLLTTKQLARILSITPSAVRKAADSGRLRGIKPTGRDWRFRWGDVIGEEE